MRRSIIIIALCLFAVLPIIAQGQNKHKGSFNYDEFRKKMELFITEEAGLTPEDAQKFFPIFREMKEKQMKLGHKIKKLKKDPLDDDDDDDKDEDEWAEAVIEIEELKVKQAQIGETYIKRLCKIISGEKVFKALKAEDTFHRQILKNFRKEDR